MLPSFFRRIVGARSTATAIGQGFLANGLMLVLNVATGIITARTLGPVGRGEVAALIAMPTFICFIAPLGLSSAIVFESGRGQNTSSALSSAALLLATLLGLVASAIAFTITPWVLATHSHSLVAMAALLSVFTVPGLLSNLGMAVLQGAHRFRECNLVRISQPIVTILALGLLLAGPGLTPLQVALVTLSAGFPGLFWNLWLIWPKTRVTRQELRAAVTKLYGYALRACFGELLSGLAGQLDKILVVALYAPHEAGLFMVALGLSRILLVAPQAATQVLFSRTVGRSTQEVVATVTRTAAVTLAMVAAGILLLGISGASLLATLYSPEFVAGAALLQLLLVEAGLSAIHQVISQPFLSLDRPSALGVQQAAGITTSIALLLLLSGHLGITGAGWALLAGSAVRLMLAVVMFKPVLGHAAPAVLRELGPSLTLLAQRIRGGTL
jgi:O-antigen/teichoic acid export membrane protein